MYQTHFIDGRMTLREARDMALWAQDQPQAVYKRVRDYTPREFCDEMTRAFHFVRAWSDIFRSYINMPTKTTKEAWMTDWISVKLTEEEKEAFEAWDVQDADIFDGLNVWAAQGNKIGLTFQQDTRTYQANCTCTEVGSVNKGKGVSAFAPDAYTALRLLLFKLQVILPPSWADYAGARSETYG